MLVRNFNPGEAVTVTHVPTGDKIIVANTDQVQCRIGIEGDRNTFAIAPAPRLRLELRPAHFREALRHWVGSCGSADVRSRAARAVRTTMTNPWHDAARQGEQHEQFRND